nr:MAG TPA: hypothetical protein [Caudoviricetes sp.]
MLPCASLPVAVAFSLIAQLHNTLGAATEYRAIFVAVHGNGGKRGLYETTA